MDKRLVKEYSDRIWENGVPPTSQLCRFAVIYARLDREQSTDTGEDDVLTPYLGNILDLGFRSDGMPEIAAGDYDRLNERLLTPARSRLRRRVAQSIGDRLLFFTSQESRVGRTESWGLSTDGLIGLGSTAYLVAAAHTDPKREEFLHYIFSQLANKWPVYQSLLATAGNLLGFEDTTSFVLASEQLPATVDNVLEAISIFGKEPTLAHWDSLADLASRLNRANPEFQYELPPRPDA